MAATHGGARMGAGRPKGGVSQTRRLIASAITQGLAQAGRRRYPHMVSNSDTEEAATQTAAMIVSDMVDAGQGNDVLKLLVTTATKETTGNDPASTENTLARALSQLPSGGSVPFQSHDGDSEAETRDSAGEGEGGALPIPLEALPNDPKNGTWFSPQQSLLNDADPAGHLSSCPPGEPASDTNASGATAPARTPAAAPPPCPPPGHHSHTYQMGAENFEKIR